MEEDQQGELVPVTGRRSPAAAWESLLGAMHLFFTISPAAGARQLEICWQFQFGSGISWQRGVEATGVMVMTEAKVLAGASASGHFQVEVMEVLAEHWEIKWWPFSSLFCYWDHFCIFFPQEECKLLEALHSQ